VTAPLRVIEICPKYEQNYAFAGALDPTGEKETFTVQVILFLPEPFQLILNSLGKKEKGRWF
jgi:hypothetical protein